MVPENLESVLGQRADDHVRDCWRAGHTANLVISDGYLHDGPSKISLRLGWGGLRDLDKYLAVIRLMLKTEAAAGADITRPAATGHGRKPDLADIDLRLVWEVKPNHRRGRADGAAQLAIYLALLDTAEREYLALARTPRYRSHIPQAPLAQPRPWRPGGPFPVHPLLATIASKSYQLKFLFPDPGLITWEIA